MARAGALLPAVIPCGACDLCKRGKEAICRAQFVPGCGIHGRFGQPEEIANAILFFACERSRYCTGQVLVVSGGLTMVG
jgi:NAD(P)-dependent dehydrogenase (short-subunit alcohol dehydrogenase family)